MKKILVSIIVPVYNSSKYLQNCIECLINQTYKNIEMIFINDGSTDNSLEILKKYKRDKRIRIINQKNQGANLARTNGLKLIQGDYVMFVDSDDYILPNTIYELVELLNKKKTDIIKYGFINFDTGKIESKLYSNKKALLEQLLTTSNLNNITNEIISKKAIKLSDDVFSIKSSNAEDLMMNLSFYDHAKSILVIDKKYYYYTYNADSTTKTLNTDRILSSIKDYNILLTILLNYANKWNINDENIIDRIHFRNITSICSSIIKIIDFKCDKNIVLDINTSISNTTISKHDYKKIIRRNERHLLNRRIYYNILSGHYKRAKFLYFIKKILLKIKYN